MSDRLWIATEECFLVFFLLRVRSASLGEHSCILGSCSTLRCHCHPTQDFRSLGLGPSQCCLSSLARKARKLRVGAKNLVLQMVGRGGENPGDFLLANQLDPVSCGAVAALKSSPDILDFYPS